MIPNVDGSGLRHNRRHKPDNVVVPAWFSNLLRTHAPVVKNREAWLRREIEPERREWERKVSEIWKELSEAFPEYKEQHLSELIHCCWSYGAALKSLRPREGNGTSKEKKQHRLTLGQLDKEHRRQSQRLADEVRACGSLISKIRNNPILPERNFNATSAAIYRLIADAFVSTDENGSQRDEFPSLTADLNRLADRIEACLRSRVVRSKRLKTSVQEWRDVLRISLLGDAKYGSVGMIPLATDSHKVVRRALLARLVNLLHPELRLVGEDIRLAAQRLARRSAASTHP